MAICKLNGCELNEGDAFCTECGEAQPGAELATEQAYWKGRKPARAALKESLSLGQDAVHPELQLSAS